MCTSIAMKTEDFYFGRNMDLEYELGGCVVVTPRHFPFHFRRAGTMNCHHAMIGMAVVKDGYPLYAEAANEKGLCMAGLNFPDNAYYPREEDPSKVNISPFELIQWILGRCSTLAQARTLLADTHLVNISFSEQLPLSPLHWHLADREGSIVVESTKNGLSVHDNPAGVMTNNPSFDFQMTNLCQYLNLSPTCPQNCFSEKIHVKPFGLGMGCIGLPGDYSPASRFVKTAFLNLNVVCPQDDQGSLAQFFHMLDAVAMVRGSVVSPEGRYETTIYSCCINASRGTYYYKTYCNNQFTAICMNRTNLNACCLHTYPLVETQQVAWMN